jgi:hypothetical protein
MFIQLKAFFFQFCGFKIWGLFSIAFFFEFFFFKFKKSQNVLSPQCKICPTKQADPKAKYYTTMGAMRAQGDTLCELVGW